MNKKIFLVVLGSLAMGFQVAVTARQPLTFEQRVKAQEAIERVYYAHRIWPKENPGPKPPFEQMVSRTALEGKVTDYLKKSAALGEFWQRPIQPEQLQAEMDRMAKGTKDPATLRELYAALNNDPYVIAECLARPILADRLIRNWYANDERFHGETKAKAEAALKNLTDDNFDSSLVGMYYRCKIKKQTSSARGMAHGFSQIGPRDQSVEDMPEEDYNQIEWQLSRQKCLSIQEDTNAFSIARIRSIKQDEMEIEGHSFKKRTFDEWWESSKPNVGILEYALDTGASATSLVLILPEGSPATCQEGWTSSSSLSAVPDGRYGHTMVWTGTEMIVWGGNNCTDLNTGGRYNPATDTWAPTSTGSNCPSGRYWHVAVWTGTDMIIWGGLYGSGNPLNTGARYTPSSNTWMPTSTGTNCPSARSGHTAVWTGTEMIIWGGTYNTTGGRYNPSNDSWKLTSTGTNCPSARSGHTAVWTGAEMIIWGGASDTTGGRYNPLSDTWRATSTGVGCPSARSLHTAVWTGTEMIVWGGQVYDQGNTGGRYNPTTDTWTATSVGLHVPESRCRHTAIWTGSKMIVWGGTSTTVGDTEYASGGCYDPGNDSWTLTSIGANCPHGRTGHCAIWTGTEMIVWGGADHYAHDIPSPYMDTGGRYDPLSDSWVPTQGITNAPSARYGQASLWTGNELIIWGGKNFQTYYRYYLDSGGVYIPALDSWCLTSQGAGCPLGRWYAKAIWDGREMILWGGDSCETFAQECSENTGAKYSPVLDQWTPTSNGPNCPYGRILHSAIWTGTKMIIWGGVWICGNYYGYPDDGASYDPSVDVWSPISTGSGNPSGRECQTTIWTGKEMIVWGGEFLYMGSAYALNDGGCYDPVRNQWTPISGGPGCPGKRFWHMAVWTGSEMIIWGGYCAEYEECAVMGDLNTGGRYNPSTDTWETTSVGQNCPYPRHGSSALWTGSEMIIWGGYTDLGVSDNGARYAPATNSWTTMGQGMACPSARGEQSSVWTGSSMIVWGGYTGDAYLGSGGIYSPGTALVPIISGPSEGCLGSSVVLSTDNYSAYQWYKDGSPISGAVAQTCSVSQAGSYTVAATDAYGCTGQSNAKAITFTTGTAPPVAPKNINAVGICGEIVVTWDVSDGATSYNLLRGATCSTPETVFTEVISPYSDTTAIPGMIYQYAVVALNACGSSARSSCVAASSIGVPAVPSGPIFTSVTSTSVSLNWAMVTGATSYDVWRAEGNSCSGAVKITASPISGTKYNDASLKACTQYSYYVVANNECGASANGACASVTTSAQIPAAPAAPTFSAISCTTLTVNWAEVAGATGYDVWRAIGASCAGAVKISASPVSGTSFNDSGLESFAQYSYFVVASNNCGSSANGVCASVTTTALPEVPGDVSAVGTCGGVTLSWAPSLGATSYNVLRGTVCGAAVTMFTNVTRSFIDTTAVPGTNYQYWVVGVNSCGTSQNSTCAAAKRLGVPAAPLSPSFTAVGCAGLTVNWASAAGATSYDVWRAVGATCDGAVKINGAPMTGTSYNDGSLVSGTQYSYFITANNDCGASGNGGCASVTATAVPSPTISGSSANVCPTPYVALAASAGYVAYQWNFNGVPISGATQSTYNVSLSGNYSVTATDANGCIGTSAQKAVTETYCATAEVSPAEAPVPVRLAKDATSPTGYYLYFQKAANATGYNIYEGNIGTWYSHANAAGNLCHAAVTDLGTGEMRAIITPSSDGRYYLVTAYRVTKEGPSGYDSSGNEVPASQSTCSP